jgi:hypothetical protein
MGKDLANHEIVTLAVYLMGGESQYVDTEDVAIKANELAPGRFTWRKYRAQINIDTVRKRLWDAKKPEKGSLLIGSEKKGWLLTSNGLSFARDRAQQIQGQDLERERVSLKEKQWRRAERERLISSAAFQAYKRGGIAAVRRQDAEAFFRLDSYVIGPLRERKLLRVVNSFQNDPDLGEAVKVLAEKVKGEPNDART